MKLNYKLTNKQLIGSVEDYVQCSKVKRSLSDYFEIFSITGSLVQPEEKVIVHDADIISCKKKGVPAGAFQIEQSKLIKGLADTIRDEYQVNVAAFPNFKVEVEAGALCLLTSKSINNGLKYNTWKDLYGQMSNEEIELLKESPIIKGVLPLHNITYATSTDFNNDSFNPEKFRNTVLKGALFLYGDADGINNMDEKNNENRQYIDTVMKVEGFKCINSNYPEQVQSQKIGLITDNINKHLFEQETNYKDSTMSRKESKKLLYDLFTRLDNRIAANA